MLQGLKIENFALIRSLKTEFGSGLNIITGETGAGKSILLGALGLLLGDRADSSVMLDKERKCIAEGHFYPVPEAVKHLLEGTEVWTEAGEALRIRREIAPGGKSRALINETVVTLSLLKEVGYALCEIHGQQDTRLINDAQIQLEFLDTYAGTGPELQTWSEVFSKWKSDVQKLRTLQETQSEWLRQQEYVQFQYSELSAAQVQAGEDERIDQELMRLESAEQIQETLMQSLNGLYEQDGSVYNQIAALRKGLSRYGNIDARLEAEAMRLDQANELIREVFHQLQSIQEDGGSDGARLQTLQERQNMYQKLKLKYQVRTSAELLEVQSELETQIQAGDQCAEGIQKLQKEIRESEVQLEKIGKKLDDKRRKQVDAFCKGIQQILQQVGMEQAECFGALEIPESEVGVLEIQGKKVQPLRKGLNTFQLLIRTNKGTPAGPLQSIASGGELSRIMLAIKSILAQKAGTPVMIFDEIDTGISGETAMKVGRVMRQLGGHTQVLSITHLPQIAAMGHSHYVLFKITEGDTTSSDIRKVEGDERLQVLAHMIGGEQAGKAALESAREFILMGNKTER